MTFRITLFPAIQCSDEYGVLHMEDPLIKKLYSFAWSIKNMADLIDPDPYFDDLYNNLAYTYMNLYEKIIIEDMKIRTQNENYLRPTYVPNFFKKQNEKS
jgi:hypothetical protein